MAATHPTIIRSVLHDGRTIHIDGDISTTMATVRQQLRQLALVSREPITLVICSGGGAVTGGLALLAEIAAVRHAGVEVVGYVQGMAASMAFSILQGCSYRVADEAALLMAHGIFSAESGDRKDRAANQKKLDLMNDATIRLYAARTAPLGGMDADAWRDLLEEDTAHWYGADEALAGGMIDAVVRLPEVR